MPSNTKIKERLHHHKYRSCKCKKNYTLLKGWCRVFLLKIRNNGTPNIYKCLYEDHYHVGNMGKNTIKKYNYMKSLQKRLILGVVK